MSKKFSFISQRGAMFGLDARIALAIFGIITILVGYTGIAKLATASNAAFIKEILAYEDALVQMQADLGVFHQFAVATSNGVNDFNAIEFAPNIAAQYRNRWNGPYIEGIRQNHPTYGNFTVTYKQEDGSTVCNINNNCFVWINLTNTPQDIWEATNRYIDENGGKKLEATPTSSGRVRSTSTAATRLLEFRTKAMRQAG